MSVSPANTIFYGPVINPESPSSFQALPRCLLAIDATGEIVWIEKDVPEAALKDVLVQHGSDKIIPHTLKHGEFLLPGFVDTHTVRTRPSHTMCGRGDCIYRGRLANYSTRPSSPISGGCVLHPAV